MNYELPKLNKEVADLLDAGILTLYKEMTGDRYLISAKGEAYFWTDSTGEKLSKEQGEPDFSNLKRVLFRWDPMSRPVIARAMAK